MHFSFLPFWLMKSRLWLGALCLKHCLGSHSLFTSDTERRCAAAAATTPSLQRRNFLDLYSAVRSRYQVRCSHVLGSVVERCKEKQDYKSYLLKKKKKTVGNTLILSTACQQYKWPPFPRNASTFRLVTTEVWLVFIPDCPAMHLYKYPIPLLACGGAASRLKQAQMQKEILFENHHACVVWHRLSLFSF